MRPLHYCCAALLHSRLFSQRHFRRYSRGHVNIVLLSAALITGCSSSKTTHDTPDLTVAAWQQHPLVIDGFDDDWSLALPYYDKKERLNYAISNDRDNVYIRLAIQNPQEQQKIVEGGMTVWVNGNADKTISTGLGIGFPLDPRNDRDKQLMAQARPDQYKDKPRRLEDLTEFSLYGYKPDGSIPTYDISQGNESGVQVRMNVNRGGALIYEASVPLSVVYPQNTSHNFAGKTIAVGFVVEGLPPNVRVRSSGGGGGGGGVSIGGGLGMGSFGGGGGMGIGIGTGSLGHIGGKGGDRQLYDQSETWQVVSLARPGQ